MNIPYRIVGPICLVALFVITAACGSDETQEPNQEQNQCVPDSCEDRGYECGEHPDGCDDTIDCGDCGDGICSNGICVDEPVTDPPVVTIEDGPDELTASTSASFEFSCDLGDCEFECMLGNTFDPCSSPMTYSDLSDGEHLFRVRAYTDTAEVGDWTDYEWTVDTEVPEIVDLSGPNDPSGQTDATFEFGCSKADCDFACALNGSDFEACESGISYTDLAEEEHFFEVYAVDALDNESEVATWEWTIDTTVPDVVDLDGPDDPTNQSDATFSFDCSKSDCDFECSLNGALFAACNSGITYHDLPDGGHSFEVQPIDAGGNVGGVATWEWTVDTVPPVVVFTEEPDIETSETEATFEFSCADDDCVEFECALDTEDGDGDYEICTSPQTVTDLEDGIYIFNVRATDAAGNTAEDSRIWEVDTEPPEVVFTEAPDVETDETEATFEFSCVEDDCVEFECALDTEEGDGEFETCTSPKTFTDLENGVYVFNVRGTDEVGNTGENSHIWEIESFGWSAVAPGFRHTCAIANSGALYCWGDNEHGQLGDGTEEDRLTPTQVGSEEDWIHIAADFLHTCGIRADQTLYCWGHNSDGRLGIGNEESASTPTAVEEQWNWNTVSLGEFHTCGIRDDDTVWCWGDNHAGQLGDGTEDDSSQPVMIDDSSQSAWTDVSAGAEVHTCARRDDGTLWCWGSNFKGTLARDYPDTETSDVPVQIGSDDDWSDVGVGRIHSCGLRTSGEIWCWGDNQSGQVGDNAGDDTSTPVQVGAEDHWDWAAIGGWRNCASPGGGELYCWGMNAGDGGEENSDLPVAVDGPSDWQSVTAGYNTCGVRDDHSLWCWGENDDGQLGDGTEESSYVPVEVVDP